MRTQTPVIVLLMFFSIASSAQITGPEQDCIGATPLCNPVYMQNISYQGAGEIEDLPDGTSCLENEENNSVWFTFEIADSGVLEFVINSRSAGGTGFIDYDFSLFDITGRTCADIADSALEVRCNYAFSDSLTGLRSGDTAFIAGSGGPSFLAPLAVIPGQKLALLVDNFSTTDDGFTLDFSASTASFATPASPSLTVTNFESVNDSAIRVETSYSIFCSSIASDGSDFSITGPTAITITEATVLNCDTATLTSTIYLYYTGHLIDGGTYTLTPKTGTDGNGLLTLCVEVEQTGTSFIARDTVIFTSVDLTVEPRIQLSPNPTYDNLIIKTDASFSSACQVEMYDVFGKRVYHEVNQLVGGQIEIQLDNLTSGIYFFRLSDDGFIATRRFTVLK